MTTKGFSRREFLQTSSVAAAGVAAVSAGAVIIDPNGAWAMTTTTLDEHQAMTLLKMSRHLYPHDMLGDQYYAKVVEAVDRDAAKDPDLTDTLSNGIADLDGRMGIEFVHLSEGSQLKALHAIEDTGFFGTMRTATLNNLYGDPLVYRYFGYEGSSVEHGGYINRGFDDIGWLPKA